MCETELVDAELFEVWPGEHRGPVHSTKDIMYRLAAGNADS